MTKTVADAAMLLQAIAGHDPLDPSTTQDPVPDYTKALTGNVKGVRIGVPTNYFFDNVDARAVAGVRAAIATLQKMGATLVDVEVPHAELAGSAGWIVAMAEAACFHEQRLRNKPDPLRPHRSRAPRRRALLPGDRLHQVAARAIDADGFHAAGAREVRRARRTCW